MHNSKTSIIILNYNGRRFLRKLFKTLTEQTVKKFEIIFVDNSSTDDSIRLLAELLKNYPYSQLDVTTIVNEKNFGFCEGNNIGLKQADGDYVLFLNNDTYLEPKWLEHLVDVMDAHPDVGACQSRLVFASSGTIQNDGHLFDLYGWGKEVILDVNSNLKNVGYYQDIFYLSGTSIIVRKSALVKTGNFDMQIFYGDYDLCWRLRLMGYSLATSLKSICYHYGSIATKSVMSKMNIVYTISRERLRVLLKSYSLMNCFKRLPLCIFLMFFESSCFTLKFKTPLYILQYINAIRWNIDNFKDTLIARHKIQCTRVVSDNEIQTKMSRYPLLLHTLLSSIFKS